jgi:hypothetical protein
MGPSPEGKERFGAGERARTADLVLTKDVLCQLSYPSTLERGTRFELATTSLEGWSSTN